MNTKEMIDLKATKLRSETLIQLDLDRQREDLYGLYSDIVSALHKRGGGEEHMLYDYAEALDLEQGFFQPEAAYNAGLHTNREVLERGLMDYLCGLYLDPDHQKTIVRRDELFRALSVLLGEADGLISEFSELYKACNGINSDQIQQFYQLGFEERGRCCELFRHDTAAG